MRRHAVELLLCVGAARGLDNGYRLPALGWSSWYGFTSNIDETMIQDMADGLVSSGLLAAGYRHVWIDDGYALPRNNVTGRVTVDPALFPRCVARVTQCILRVPTTGGGGHSPSDRKRTHAR